MEQNENTMVEEVRNAGFDSALAIATEEEVQAGAACGQLTILNDEETAEA